MKYKADWPEAKERLAALWEGKCLDRPCVAVRAPNGKEMEWPPEPVSPERKWTDPEWVIKDALAKIGYTWWGGEAIPSYLLFGGYIAGGMPRYEWETIWLEEMDVDFDAPSPHRERKSFRTSLLCPETLDIASVGAQAHRCSKGTACRALTVWWCSLLCYATFRLNDGLLERLPMFIGQDLTPVNTPVLRFRELEIPV